MSATATNDNKSHSSELLDKNLKENSISEKLNFIGSKKSFSKNSTQKSTSTKPQICRVSNNTELLSKVKGFLPQIKTANHELKQKVEQSPDELSQLDIENVDDCTKVIEMDLSFVKDLKETALNNFLTELSSDSETDSSDNDEIINIPQLLGKVSKP